MEESPLEGLSMADESQSLTGALRRAEGQLRRGNSLLAAE